MLSSVKHSSLFCESFSGERKKVFFVAKWLNKRWNKSLTETNPIEHFVTTYNNIHPHRKLQQKETVD
jgi:hypothetical protein